MSVISRSRATAQVTSAQRTSLLPIPLRATTAMVRATARAIARRTRAQGPMNALRAAVSTTTRMAARERALSRNAVRRENSAVRPTLAKAAVGTLVTVQGKAPELVA